MGRIAAGLLCVTLTAGLTSCAVIAGPQTDGVYSAVTTELYERFKTLGPLGNQILLEKCLARSSVVSNGGLQSQSYVIDYDKLNQGSVVFAHYNTINCSLVDGVGSDEVTVMKCEFHGATGEGTAYMFVANAREDGSVEKAILSEDQFASFKQTGTIPPLTSNNRSVDYPCPAFDPTSKSADDYTLEQIVRFLLRAQNQEGTNDTPFTPLETDILKQNGL